MDLLTAEQRARLLANGRAQAPVRGTSGELDFAPVVKLFTPDAGCTWLLSELDPEDPDVAFGLCDLGLGFPELGLVRLSEIASLGATGMPVERDVFFAATKSIADYAAEADRAGCITA